MGLRKKSQLKDFIQKFVSGDFEYLWFLDLSIPTPTHTDRFLLILNDNKMRPIRLPQTPK